MAVAIVFGLLFAGLALIEPTAFARGLLLGAGLATIGCGLCFFVLMHDGSYSWRRGAESEEWTADLLAKHLPAWTLVHGLFLVSADVDHIAIGPGGVIAVETKWTSSEWESRSGRNKTYVAAVAQARQSAARLQRFLATKGFAIDVRAALVVWGRGAPRFASGMSSVDGVLVVNGQADPDLRSQFRDIAGFEAAPIVSVLRAQD